MAIELPEAVTLSRQMNIELKGKTIARVDLSADCASLIRQGFINLNDVDLAGATVASVDSKGKWIFVILEPGMVLLFALETGGKILYHRSDGTLPEKYHVRIAFTDQSFLTERIVGWGWAKAVREDELASQRFPGSLGLSPVDEHEFTFQKFSQILADEDRKIIKAILLDQRGIAGIGNGYLQDILFKAKIHPKRKAAEIGDIERVILYHAVLDILKEAVRLGGSEFEYNLYNQAGEYKRLMGEPMKGKPCPICGTAIEKINVLGASAYICPCCQQ